MPAVLGPDAVVPGLPGRLHMYPLQSRLLPEWLWVFALQQWMHLLRRCSHLHPVLREPPPRIGHLHRMRLLLGWLQFLLHHLSLRRLPVRLFPQRRQLPPLPLCPPRLSRLLNLHNLPRLLKRLLPRPRPLWHLPRMSDHSLRLRLLPLEHRMRPLF
jgi:hypothetical protein